MPEKTLDIPITDPNNVQETFATSVVQVGMISGSAVAVTLGVQRHLRSDFGSEPEETVCISSRLVLTLDAAQNLVDAVSTMLARKNHQSEAVTQTPKQNSARTKL